ncbi:alpha/beta fold hydrolase [Sphaerisporangium fuscum]|uniref:alpha/beta fold hydrolase n=1 Tax=Sphaerisporangium fuscum TaxID=2835868 RepID=UPI001BDCA739|nr:alpha/beta fold hydrolase [Sphaerisporangium fuscum]
MPSLTDQFLGLPSGRTHHRLDGPTDAPLVVFVPGATLPMFVWDGLADAVAEAGYRVLRYDLLGRGASAAPRITYDAEAYDRQLTELLDGVQATGPVHLVALAFGALIAARFADRHPERVASLTYVAPDGFGVRESPAVRLLHRPVIGEALLKVAGTAMLLSRLPDYSPRADVVEAVRAKFRPYVSAPGFQRAVLSSIREMPIHDAAAWYRPNSDRGVPTLVLWGSADRVTPLPDEARLSAALPHAQVHVFDGVGHLPHAERPADTTTVLTRFLASVPIS